MARILFFTKGTRSLASSRIRAFLVSDQLQALGHDAPCYTVVTRPWWSLSPSRISELWRNIRLLASLRGSDTLYCQRTVYQLDFMALVLLRKWIFRRPYVFDFDDAIYMEKAHVAHHLRLMMRSAALVIVPNHFLREYVLHYTDKVEMLPSLIDTEGIYALIPKEPQARVRIGWTGTPVHYENLQLVVPALERLAGEGAPVEFMLVSGSPRIHELVSSVKGLAVNWVNNIEWGNPRVTASYVMQFDIGITPLTKTEWNRGKDPGKTKEYLACAAAVVASDWGENKRVITHGQNGLLADTEEDWYDCLKRLVDNKEYRETLAKAGRTYVEETYSYGVLVPKLLGMLEKVRQ